MRGAVRVAMEEAQARSGDSGMPSRATTGADGATTGPTDASGASPAPVVARQGSVTPMLPEQDRLTTWPEVPDGVIPRQVESTGPQGLVVRGYPALVEVPGPRGDGADGVPARARRRRAPRPTRTASACAAWCSTETALNTPRVTSRWTGRRR